jgi:[ribosomal protein S5]-alanine N-acetyltransferase
MIPFLATARLLLYPMTVEHCSETYRGWLHDKDVTRFLETGMFPTSMEQLRSFVQDTQQKPVLFLAIYTKTDNKHIGNIKIDSINRIHGTAEYGILMGDKTEWGKGYGREASEIIIEYCFMRMNIRKITLGVVADNTAAVQLYYKMGFQLEGTYQQHCFYDGAYRNVHRMAIFAADYMQKNSQ